MNTTTPSNNITIVRNYMILAVITMAATMALTYPLMNPSRGGQQTLLNRYGKVVSTGIVAYYTNLRGN